MAERADHHLVCGSLPCNRASFERLAASLPGTWGFAATTAELDAALAEGPEPRWIFFLHWSWIVPASVYERFDCVVFHMTDLPYGRGGSPLQHLILAGVETTQLSAIVMTAELDAGDVYAKRPLSLAGTAQDIYERSDQVAEAMIADLVAHPRPPVPQEGEPVVFVRRRPEQSEVPTDLVDLDAWYDFVRMLDAEGYPHAFIDHGGYRITMRSAERHEGRLTVAATIERAPHGDPAKGAP